MLEKVYLKDRLEKNITVVQEDFYYIAFKIKLIVFPERIHSIFQFE